MKKIINKKRNILLISLLAILMLVGCGKQNSETDKNENAVEATPTSVEETANSETEEVEESTATETEETEAVETEETETETEETEEAEESAKPSTEASKPSTEEPKPSEPEPTTPEPSEPAQPEPSQPEPEAPAHTHNFTGGDCSHPSTCSCGATGSYGAHNWKDTSWTETIYHPEVTVPGAQCNCGFTGTVDEVNNHIVSSGGAGVCSGWSQFKIVVTPAWTETINHPEATCSICGAKQ